MTTVVREDTCWQWIDKHFDEGVYDIHHLILAFNSRIVAVIKGILIDKTKMNDFYSAITADYDALPEIGETLFDPNGMPRDTRLRDFCAQLNGCTARGGRLVYINRVEINGKLISERGCDDPMPPFEIRGDIITAYEYERRRSPIDNETFSILQDGLTQLLQNELTLSSPHDLAIYVSENKRDEELFRKSGFTSFSEKVGHNGYNVMFASYKSISAMRPATPTQLPYGWDTIHWESDYLVILRKYTSSFYVSSDLDCVDLSRMQYLDNFSDVEPIVYQSDIFDTSYTRQPDGTVHVKRAHQEFCLSWSPPKDCSTMTEDKIFDKCVSGEISFKRFYKITRTDCGNSYAVFRFGTMQFELLVNINHIDATRE